MLVSYSQFVSFSSTFKKISYVYQQFCNAQMYSSQLVVYREYLYYYYDVLPYFSSIYTKQYFYDQIVDVSEKLQKFVGYDLQQDYSYMKSDALTALLKNTQSSNLCTEILHLDNNNIQKDLSTCLEIQEGALRQGITIPIQKFVQEFKSEYDLT